MDTNLNEPQVLPPFQPPQNKPPHKRLATKKNLLIGLVLVAALGATLKFTILSDTTGLRQISTPQAADDNEALSAEMTGFSYAFGTPSNDDGNNIEGFEPATAEQVQALTSKVVNAGDEPSDEYDNLIEVIEYDQWNNEGQISSKVVEQFIGNSNEEQTNE